MSPIRATVGSFLLGAGAVTLGLEAAEATQRTTLGLVAGLVLVLAGLALHWRSWRGAWLVRAIAAAGGAVAGFGFTRAVQVDRAFPYAWRAFTHPDECVMPPSDGELHATVCTSADPVQLVVTCLLVGAFLLSLALAIVIVRRRRG